MLQQVCPLNLRGSVSAINDSMFGEGTAGILKSFSERQNALIRHLVGLYREPFSPTRET
jgi:hypothetical protein